MKLSAKAERAFTEYSITPSLIAPDGDAQQEENKVATLLFHDITDVYMEQKRLAYIADHDPLTDLFQHARLLQPDRKIPLFPALHSNTQSSWPARPNVLRGSTSCLGPTMLNSLMRQIGEALDALQQFDCVGCHTNRKTFLLAKRNAGQSDLTNLFEIVQACLNNPLRCAWA